MGARLTSFLILLSCFLLFFQNASAQRIDKRLKKKDKQDLRTPLRSALDEEQTEDKVQEEPVFLPAREIQALEAAIDPNLYVVGPGDIFIINIWSAMESIFNLTVSPEGQLIIPTIGTIAVDGKTLAEVQKLVQQAGAKKYLKTRISVNLFKLRTFRVHVTGQVLNPGLYVGTAVARVSDIIFEAQGLTTWASERAIQVRHRDGTSDSVDLYAYSKLGNVDANIYLRDGDVIYVPPIRFAQATVRLEGMVNDPGMYQLQEHETLHDFLLRTDAFNKKADMSTAYIERKTNANGGLETIPIFPYLKKQSNGLSEMFLQDGDVIMVPQRMEEVYVVGAVRVSGPYAYYPNLKALDYVGFAGSTDRAAKLSKIRVIRKQGGQEFRGMDIPIKPGDTVFVPHRVDFGLREVTTIISTITGILITMKAVGVFD